MALLSLAHQSGGVRATQRKMGSLGGRVAYDYAMLPWPMLLPWSPCNSELCLCLLFRQISLTIQISYGGGEHRIFVARSPEVHSKCGLPCIISLISSLGVIQGQELILVLCSSMQGSLLPPSLASVSILSPYRLSVFSLWRCVWNMLVYSIFWPFGGSSTSWLSSQISCMPYIYFISIS